MTYKIISALVTPIKMLISQVFVVGNIIAVNTDSPRANVPGFVPNYITPKYGIANQAAVATSNYRACPPGTWHIHQWC